MRYYWGVDPGKSGAIAIVDQHGKLVDGIKLSNSDRDVSSWVTDSSVSYSMSVAMLERVHAMPKQGVRSTFNFGRSFGFVCGVLTSCEVPFKMVSPQKWQREMGVLLPKAGQTEKKNKSKEVAQRLFPKVKVIHAVADALLIAEYCRKNW